MKRFVWMGIGVAIGVIAFRKISEAQSNVGPEGLNRAVGRLADGVYEFADPGRAVQDRTRTVPPAPPATRPSPATWCGRVRPPPVSCGASAPGAWPSAASRRTRTA